MAFHTSGMAPANPFRIATTHANNRAIGVAYTTSTLAGAIGLTSMVYGQLAADQWQLKKEYNALDGGWPFYRAYGTADKRYVAVGALEPAFYRQLLRLTGLDDEMDVDDQNNRHTWSDITRALSLAFQQYDRDKWARRALPLDCCVSPVLDFQEAAHYAHSVQAGWYTKSPFDHPDTLIDFR